MAFNFDDVMRLRTEAAAQGIGKKLWFDFAQIMFDGFPSLYETARQMTIHQDDLARERNRAIEALRAIADPQTVKSNGDPKVLREFATEVLADLK